jgi:hypothetical protein
MDSNPLDNMQLNVLSILQLTQQAQFELSIAKSESAHIQPKKIDNIDFMSIKEFRQQIASQIAKKPKGTHKGVPKGVPKGVKKLKK